MRHYVSYRSASVPWNGIINLDAKNLRPPANTR